VTPAVLAAVVAALVGVGHTAAHRIFADEVANRKTGVKKATIVVTALTFVSVYLVASGALEGIVG
jgi:hypothetical protein